VTFFTLQLTTLPLPDISACSYRFLSALSWACPSFRPSSNPRQAAAADLVMEVAWPQDRCELSGETRKLARFLFRPGGREQAVARERWREQAVARERWREQAVARERWRGGGES